jgi:carbamoyl-phosphate synthase large subunit
MEIVHNQEELNEYMATAVRVSPEHPILVDKYFQGKEAEVDAISDGEDVLIPGIMEHIERAGVHSGTALPCTRLHPVRRSPEPDCGLHHQIVPGFERQGIDQHPVRGQGRPVYVIEVNPGPAGRCLISVKSPAFPWLRWPTDIILGRTLKDMGYRHGLHPAPNFYAVKVPVFSFAKLLQVDITLGPEMKSTGEVMGVDKSLDKALYKALLAAGTDIPTGGRFSPPSLTRTRRKRSPYSSLCQPGFPPDGHLRYRPVPAGTGPGGGKSQQDQRGFGPTSLILIRDEKIHFVISTLTKGKAPERERV